MKNNPEIDNRINEGINETKIKEMENFAGHKFPDAYREFLFLGGENNNLGFDSEEHPILLFFNVIIKSISKIILDENTFTVIDFAKTDKQRFNEIENEEIFFKDTSRYASYYDNNQRKLILNRDY
ncbi:hypothetical protein [Chryseobacterium mucoviscidosis]|nr:hypothetical protein [Chryseobacterium mucoviscidosis]